MAVFYAEVLGFKGLGATRDENEARLLPNTSFVSNGPGGHTVAGLVLSDPFQVRLMVRNKVHRPSCLLEKSLQRLAHGTLATIALESMELRTTYHSYEKSDGRNWDGQTLTDDGPHPLTTVYVGGVAIFNELDDATIPIEIANMTLHVPKPQQIAAIPSVNVAELGTWE